MNRALACVLAVAACGRRGIDAREHGPEIAVTATSEGRTASEIEVQIAGPLENALAQVPHLAHLHTRIVAGSVTVIAELERDADREAASRDIYERVRGIQAQLPADVVPVVAHAAGPVVLRYVVRSTTMPGPQVRAWQDSVARLALVRLAGVAGVDSCGGGREEIEIRVDVERLAALGATLHEVVAHVEGRQHMLPGLHARLDPDALGAIPIANALLSDIAHVDTDAHHDCDAYDERGQVVLGSVRAQRGADPSEVRTAVERALDELRRAMPASMTLEVRTPTITLEVDAAERELPAMIRRLAHTDVDHVVIEHAHTNTLWLVPRPDAARDDVKAAALRVLSDWPVAADGDLVIALAGPDRSQLAPLAARARELVGTAAVGTGREVTVERVEVDRAAVARFGLAMTDVTQALRAASDDGLEVASWFTDERQIPIVVRCKVAALRSATGEAVPMTSIIQRVAVREPAELLREDREPWLGVRVRGDAAAMREAIDKLVPPAGYRATLVGP